MTNDEIIKQCNSFLEESEERYGQEKTRQETTLSQIEDIFDQETIKTYKRTKKKFNLQYSKLPVIIDAISSPYIDSPFHISIDDEQFKDKQEIVDRFENSLDTKLIGRQGFKRGVSVGSGVIVVGIDENDQPFLEFVENQSAIALDPNCTKPSCEDAEEAATVQFISKRKAQRMYPDADLSANSGIDFTHLTRWGNVESSVQLVSYYYKDEQGIVHLAKICGNSVQDINLGIHIVPVIRYSGYAKYRRGKASERIGIADRLHDLQLAESVAFSSMVERANRTMKARWTMSDKAASGDAVMDSIRRCENDESLVMLYHEGATPPVLNNEQFNTADLEALIGQTRTLEQDTSGILLQGINTVEKTATESKLQQLNSISNNDELYLNAEFAQRHLARVILEIICGTIPQFVLHGGVGNLEESLNNERLVADCQNLLSAGQPVLAYLAAQNSKAQIADKLMAGLKANYPDVVFPDDNLNIWQELQKAKGIANEAIAQAEQTVQENVALTQENQQLNIQVMDSKANLAQQQREFTVNTQLKILEMQQKAGIETSKLEADIQKENAKAVTEAEKLELEKAKIIADAAKQQPVTETVVIAQE